MSGRLIIEAGLALPSVIDLAGDSAVRLGRGLDNAVVLNDRHASRQHAEVFPAGGRWFIRDCESINGTRLNGRRIFTDAPLVPDAVIEIGDVRIRFNVDAALEGTDEIPAVPVVVAKGEACVRPSTADAGTTVLQADELSTLLAFMSGSLGQSTPHGLVRLALASLLEQTGAAVAGFLNLDPDEPSAKIVLPAKAQMDVQLSRRLTQRALRTRQTAWLAAPVGDGIEGGSVAEFRDALCVPLAAGGADEPPLGSLHIYRGGRPFTDREVRFCEVLAGSLAGCLRVLRARRSLEADVSRLRDRTAGGERIVGEGAAVRRLRDQIGRLADCPCTVLITGETGVGKELVAVGLHRQSQRRCEPLVAVNCAGIAPTLIESELFGYCKGAFNNATADKPGYFQLADGGTLFLDEIGELPLELQAKLLRVLDNKSFYPVGGKAEVKVDVRVVAATNRDLERLSRAGQFRADLYFRLATVTIKVPPLRERPEDVAPIAEHLLERIGAEYGRTVRLDPAALARLVAYSWPGNVRQLRSVLESAVAMTAAAVIQAGDLHLSSDAGPDDDDLPLNLEEMETRTIRAALKRTGGNKSEAAKLLGINRDTLGVKVRKFKIEATG
jgi:two-component system response regulator HydG